MSREAALQEACEQFVQQGCDLRGVDTTGSATKKAQRERVLAALAAIETGDAGVEDLETVRHCDVAVPPLCKFCLTAEGELLDKCVQVLASVVAFDRAAFRWSRGPEAALRALDFCETAALELMAAAATKCEDNKLAFRKAAPQLVRAVGTTPVAACKAIRALTAADDASTPTSSTFDTARALMDAGAVDALVDALPVALDALRQVAKSDDAVKRIRHKGGAATCRELAASSDLTVATHAIGLLRNIAANDDAKDAMCRDGTLEVLVRAARCHNDATLREHVLAVVAQMALRRPRNAATLVENYGAVDLILDTMRLHPKAVNLQRQGCLAIRNVVAREDYDEFKQRFVAAGAEDALRAAAMTAQANVDVAYAALRDLNLDAHIAIFESNDAGDLVQVQNAAFKPGSAANFRPVYDESQAILPQEQPSSFGTVALL